MFQNSVACELWSGLEVNEKTIRKEENFSKSQAFIKGSETKSDIEEASY